MNKIYIIEYKGKNKLGGFSHFVITVAASDSKTAKRYVEEKIGITNVEPVWLMNSSYPTIYISDGSKPKEIQAKILYNGSFHSPLSK